jgi:hypothetical protein
MADSIAPVSSNAAPDSDPRVLAAGVVHALYRLIKGCFLHDDTNQALVPLVDSVIDAAHQFTSRTGAPHASVLFANNSVFVNRQMLRASRDTYQLALELGSLLAPCNVTEVTIETGVNPTEVAEFGRAIAGMHRDKKPNALLSDGGWAHLRVRKVLGFGGGPVLPAVTRVARTYAASIMIVRGFYSDLRNAPKGGKLELSHALKRVAQKISGALDDEKRLLLSTAATPPADSDRAGVAVSSAIIAVLVASQLSDDRVALTNLAMAALLYDSARIRLARSANGNLRKLNEEEEELLPMSSVVAMTSLGKLHPPSIARTVILHEALALRSSATPPYGGARAPHILSRILAVARAFAEFRVARGSAAPLTIDDAIDVMTAQAADNTAKSLVKLLVGTLGVFPAGTMVELSTGELAVVLSTPRLPIDFARPPVRVMYDENARLLEEPFDVDLAAPEKGAPARFVRKPIDASDQQMKQMRSYVMSLASKGKAGCSTDPSPVSSKRPDSDVVSPRGALASRPPRSRTQDPRQDDGGGPPPDILSSRPPRPRRNDSSLNPGSSNASDDEQRYVEELGRATRAAPLPRLEDRNSSDWTALPPLPGKKTSSIAPPPTSAPPSSPRSPRLRQDTGPTPTPRTPRSRDDTGPTPRSPRMRDDTGPIRLPATMTKPPEAIRAPRLRVPSVAPPTPVKPSAAHGSNTRQMDWDQDAILARYLSDQPSAPGTDSYLDERDSRGSGDERDSRGSGNAGLRWDRQSSSGSATSVPPSSGPRSPQSGPPSSERGVDPRREVSTGGLRWGSQRPPSDETPSSQRIREEEDQPSPPPSAPPLSGRAKAGNQSWGSPKRDKR